jgi:hypothetical protein
MMAWYWQMVMALVTLNVAFVMAALLRSVIRDRIERALRKVQKNVIWHKGSFSIFSSAHGLLLRRAAKQGISG